MRFTHKFQVVFGKFLKKAGDVVKKDEKIMILEAMKMEIDIVAPEDGKIASIDVKEGEAIENEQLLATIG